MRRVTFSHDGASDLEKRLEEQYNNISEGQTESCLTYSNSIPGTSQNSADSLSNPKCYVNDGISPNFVDNFIKGESFDEQIAKFCEVQALPSLRIDQQASSKERSGNNVRFDIGSSKLLVKDEFLAAVRDDLADDDSSLYKEAPSRLAEAERKYLAGRVSGASDTAAERHLRFSSNKNLM